eukprot:GHVS01014275.1.p1 GENE.GHVS01014275.1~~GHVS01014275.1.p1  ORF type:complete len:270 (+),score=14.46 GHVS01014275.1:430-1239(+)
MCVDVMRWKLIRGLQYMMNLYEGGTEQAFYKGDKFTGMAYDTELNEAVISAVAVPDHDILTEFVKMAGGAYNLIDATAMDMLQHFPGFNICIDQAKIIEKFRADNPVKAVWAKQPKHFFTASNTLNLETEYLRVKVVSGGEEEISEIKLLYGRRIDVPIGCLKGGVNNVVNALEARRIVEGKSELLFDVGCQELALAYPTISISRRLANEPGFRPLGEVSKWAERDSREFKKSYTKLREERIKKELQKKMEKNGGKADKEDDAGGRSGE